MFLEVGAAPDVGAKARATGFCGGIILCHGCSGRVVRASISSKVEIMRGCRRESRKPLSVGLLGYMCLCYQATISVLNKVQPGTQDRIQSVLGCPGLQITSRFCTIRQYVFHASLPTAEMDIRVASHRMGHKSAARVAYRGSAARLHASAYCLRDGRQSTLCAEPADRNGGGPQLGL